MQINEAQKKLMEVAKISAGDLPKDYAENHKNTRGAGEENHILASYVYVLPEPKVGIDEIFAGKLKGGDDREAK